MKNCLQLSVSSTVLAVLCVISMPWNAAAEGSVGKRDPLGEGERSGAVAIALQGLLPGQTLTAVDLVSEAPQLVLLSSERHVEEKSQAPPGRRAAVFIYDYGEDVLHRLLVDLKNNRLDEHLKVQDVQPPLASTETREARAVIFRDGALRRRLREEFLRIEKKPLTNSNQLDSKAFIFHGSAMPNRTAAGLCGRSRCAQVLFYAGDSVALSVSPIVNLSNGSVVDVLGVSGHEH